MAAAPKLIDLDRVSVLVSHSNQQPCSSSRSDKDVTNAVSASRSEASGVQRISYQGEEFSRHLHARDKNGFLLNPRNESVHLQGKLGKVSKTGSLPKRPRIAQLEDPISVARVDGMRDMSDNLGPYITKCNSSDKTQLAKQKTKLTSKRGDRRNFKLPVKTKNDSFSVKAGLASFSSAAGGNNFFGVHGLKSDNHDVTRDVEDLPLNELLDGTYKHPSLGKDKGKKPTHVNNSFLNSIRKACSILQLKRSVQLHNISVVDSHTEIKMSSLPLRSTSVVSNGVDGDKGESSTTNLASCDKVQDSCSKPNSPANMLDVPLCQPNYILERLALPLHKDLESLLLDATKPAIFSKSTPDACSGKQMTRRTSLPPFPWSHTSSWNCRTSSDAAKMSTSRGTCQGRWLRIERNTLTSSGIATDNLTDLESMTYDRSLVPSPRQKMACSENKVTPSVSILPRCELNSSSPATCSKKSHLSLESGDMVDHSKNSNDEYCPKIKAAARTLCDMATEPFIRNPDGIMRWPNKPSQKDMKARQLKSIEKPEEVYGSSITVSGSDNITRRSMDRMLMLPPKRPKPCFDDDRKEFNIFSSVRKDPVNWSAPRSSRSLPSKASKESFGNIRHSTSDMVKHSYMMPPPSRVPERASNKREKVRKLLTMEWNRGRDRPG